MFPPLDYRPGRDDHREKAEARQRRITRGYDFGAGFFKPLIGRPFLFFLIFAARGRDLAYWISYLLMMLAIILVIGWFTVGQIPNRTSAYRLGLIWGAACGMILFFLLAVRLYR
jgi:hypothetical protein